MASTAVSPFLRIPDTTAPGTSCPSIVHLKRDHNIAVVLSSPTAKKPLPILQTRFGEFSHSSLLRIPYGSQVRATARNAGRKRKRNDKTDVADENETVGSGDGASGFVHVLAPTAELWTNSLPHRTQVVYTPDSSYVLHRLGVKAGSVVIEAGAGSGSFTHASVRACYDGEGEGKRGKVWSFEFHKDRAGKLMEELRDHRLDGVATVTHQDVCKEGFLVPDENAEGGYKSPNATAVFLDLPAPWLALPHLTRRRVSTKGTITPTALAAVANSDPSATVTATIPLQSLLDPTSTESPHLTLNPTTTTTTTTTPSPDTAPFLSPLSQGQTVRICTFSPCIEQVTRTISVLRSLGWVDITMEEIAHTRLEVRRQAAKGYDDGAGPRSLSEALTRLRAVSDFRDQRREVQIANSNSNSNSGPAQTEKRSMTGQRKSERGGRKVRGPDEGRLVTRTENEVKSHTSYLTFATLPREWTAEMEEQAEAWVKQSVSEGENKGTVGGKEKRWKEQEQDKGVEKVSRRQIKKKEREERRKREEEAGEDKMQLDLEVEVENVE